jgi:hypothetical protein
MATEFITEPVRDEQYKTVCTFLLTGNNGQDLFDVFWNVLTVEQRAQFYIEAKGHEKVMSEDDDLVIEYHKDYDNWARHHNLGYHDDPIWA